VAKLRHQPHCQAVWRLELRLVQVFSTDQQLAFELQGSSFKLVVGTLQVSRVQEHALIANLPLQHLGTF
jgi:hypothetical protein